MKPQADEFRLYLTSIGKKRHQLFIKNKSAETDFARVTVGAITHNGTTLTGKVLFARTISPLQAAGQQVFLQEFHDNSLRACRIWVIFEAVKRPELTTTFVALSPPTSKWLSTIGTQTPLDIQLVVDAKAPRGHIEELIRLSETGSGSSILLQGAIDYLE